MKGEDGELEVAVPRDRNASFDPRIVRKNQRRIDGFDDKVISMYARDMSVREIRGHLRKLYGVEVSPDLISRVTDAVLEEVRTWQNRALESVYPIVTFQPGLVDMLTKNAKKGRLIYVAGKLQTRKWSKDGEVSDRFSTEILLVPGSSFSTRRAATTLRGP